MYELIQLTEKCYYIESPARMGIIKTGENEICLIDSGNDKEAGKKVKKILDANGWRLRAIYNTHSNADHIGGNKYLQSMTGCSIYAKNIECAFTEYPILEPSFLYGGYPPSDLRHKFLLAQNSNAQNLTDEVLPCGIKTINLPGHFFDMVGFITDDGVAYLADCLSSEATLEKYGIGFIYDVAEYLKTLEYIKGINAKIFVPAHASPTENIVRLANINADKVNEIANNILNICTTSVSFEKILQKLFEIYNLSMNFEQYALVGSTVRSYLSYLKDNGRLYVEFKDNMMLWKKTED